MTPLEFKAGLKACGLKQVDLIRIINLLGGGDAPSLSPVTVYRWANGKSQVPPLAVAFLALLRRLPPASVAELATEARQSEPRVSSS